MAKQKGECTRRTCPQNHSLKYKKAGRVMKDCNICLKEMRGDSYMTCEECEYLVCANCTRAP